METIVQLQEVEGICARYPINGINLLEYQPRDITLHRTHSELIVSTPQALVTHPLTGNDSSVISAFRAELPDTDIQSMAWVGDRLFALSMGPIKTELIEFDPPYQEIKSRIVIHDTTSTTGSMVFVPSSSFSSNLPQEEEEEEGKFYIYLDGTMHSYHLRSQNTNGGYDGSSSSYSLSRTSSINMKVLNRGSSNNSISNNGHTKYDDNLITAMEYFDGLLYVLRGNRNVIEAWDWAAATQVAEFSLPTVAKHDHWVGMAFERRTNALEDTQTSSSSMASLRKSRMTTADETVYLHMSLDTFPPQIWSFRLEEHNGMFHFPLCV
jgi:hypothetical protein